MKGKHRANCLSIMSAMLADKHNTTSLYRGKIRGHSNASKIESGRRTERSLPCASGLDFQSLPLITRFQSGD